MHISPHDYDLPEEPDEITDAAIQEAYREALENPATPEAMERLQNRLFGLLAKYTREGGGNEVTDSGDGDAEEDEDDQD